MYLVGLILLSQLMAMAAFGEDVGLPPHIIKEVNALPVYAGPGPLAELYFCDPYCEIVGSFDSKKKFLVLSKEMLTQGVKPENLLKLRLQARPEEFANQKPTREGEPSLNRDKNNLKVRTENSNGDLSGNEKKPDSDDVSFKIDSHLSALLSGISLSTTANTDVISDASPFGLFGGGLNIETQKLGTFWGGELSAPLDLNFLTSAGQKPTVTSSGQIWSSQRINIFTGAYLNPKRGQWRYGLLLEGRYESENASADTAIGFSSQYLWISLGADIKYKKLNFQIFQSVYNETVDVGLYRGTLASSTRLGFHLSWCKNLKNFGFGSLAACPTADYMMINVSGSGSPSQPVFTTNPTYQYSIWNFGLEVHFGEVIL